MRLNRRCSLNVPTARTVLILAASLALLVDSFMYYVPESRSGGLFGRGPLQIASGNTGSVMFAAVSAFRAITGPAGGLTLGKSNSIMMYDTVESPFQSLGQAILLFLSISGFILVGARISSNPVAEIRSKHARYVAMVVFIFLSYGGYIVQNTLFTEAIFASQRTLAAEGTARTGQLAAIYRNPKNGS